MMLSATKFLKKGLKYHLGVVAKTDENILAHFARSKIVANVFIGSDGKTNGVGIGISDGVGFIAYSWNSTTNSFNPTQQLGSNFTSIGGIISAFNNPNQTPTVAIPKSPQKTKKKV